MRHVWQEALEKRLSLARQLTLANTNCAQTRSKRLFYVFTMKSTSSVAFLTYEESPDCHPSDQGLAAEFEKRGCTVNFIPW